MTDPVTEARDALAKAFETLGWNMGRADWNIADAERVIAALPDGWTLARAEAGVSVEAVRGTVTLADHQDDSYGQCSVCRVYVPHTDDEYLTVPFPCPTVALARAEAGVSVEALHRDHHPVPYHWSQSGERGTVCAGSLVGLHHRVELWPCDVERAIQTALAARSAGPGSRVERDGVTGRPDAATCTCGLASALDDLIALARAEAGVSVEALAAGDVARALHDSHKALGYWPDPDRIDGLWEMWGVVLHSSLQHEAAALAARSAGPGSRVERDGVTEAMQRNDFLHVLDLALASNGHPGLPVVAILRDIEAGGYTYRLSDRALALARPTPPPAVEWCQWRSPSGSGCPFPPDHEVHDEERARAAGRRFHPLTRPTPPPAVDGTKSLPSFIGCIFDLDASAVTAPEMVDMILAGGYDISGCRITATPDRVLVEGGYQAHPTPPPAVDGTREVPEWLARKHEYHTEHPRDFDFWCVASCHDDGRCDGACDPDCESCPVECPLCSTATPPDPDRLRALEAALRYALEHTDCHCASCDGTARALLADGERSDG